MRRNDLLALVALSPVLRYDGWAIRWYQPLLKIPFMLGFRNWSYKEREPFGLRNIEMRRRVAKAVEKGGVTEVGAAEIPARQLHAAGKMMAFVRKDLQSIQAPLLVVHAVDDETAAPRNAEQILREVRSEVRKAVWLGDCYHIITFDNEREIVTNETAGFINQATQLHDQAGHFRKSPVRSALRYRHR
jgi:carboxylesterase